MLRIGVTQRMNSSTPVAPSRAGSSSRSWRWSGWRASSTQIAPITVRVVSAPPSSRRSASCTISSSSRARTVPSGNSTSLWAHTEMRSSRGSARRAAKRLLRRDGELEDRVRWSGRRPDAAMPSAVYWPPSYIVTSDHSRHLGQRSGSKPSSSPMTRAGSGAASDCTTSHSPRSMTASMSSFTTPRMWSSCSFTDFGVNRRATRRRLFWCNGSSLLIDDTSPTIFGREP